MVRKTLLLGGTTEAHELLVHLARVQGRDSAVGEVILSLAGIAAPLREIPPFVEVRRGGFGGVRGLGEFLRDRGITDLIDATHPFAATMAQAAAVAATPPIRMVKLLRPPGEFPPGLVVMPVASLNAAALLVGQMDKNCLVLLGSRGGQQFKNLFSGRAEGLWLHSSLTDSRPPVEVLSQTRAELLLLRDSGGALNQKWLNSAAAVGVKVVLLTRPPPLPVLTVGSVAAVLHWFGSPAAAAFSR